MYWGWRWVQHAAEKAFCVVRQQTDISCNNNHCSLKLSLLYPFTIDRTAKSRSALKCLVCASGRQSSCDCAVFNSRQRGRNETEITIHWYLIRAAAQGAYVKTSLCFMKQSPPSPCTAFHYTAQKECRCSPVCFNISLQECVNCQFC